MGEQKTIRIVIVDDHPIVREGFGSMIATEPDMAVVAEARDGRRRPVFGKHRPDVTLMDLRMPGLAGRDHSRDPARIPAEPIHRAERPTTATRTSIARWRRERRRTC